MNRKKSISLLVVGVIMTFATLLGVFAATHDTADTGELEANSSALATSVDLKIANTLLTNANTNCSTLTPANYVDNQTVQPLVFNNADPGDEMIRYLCVQNTGAENANINLDLFGVSNTDTACTGDEISFDAASCGTGAGELGALLNVDVYRTGTAANSATSCDGSTLLQPGAEYNSGIVASSGNAIGAIGAGEFACYRVRATYPTLGVSADEEQEAQSDRVAWKFEFNGNS